jgi:hypothetical protein
MSDEKKTKKKLIQNEEDNDGYSDTEHETTQCFLDRQEEERENEYFSETVNMMRKAILTYIEDKSLTIGEYISPEVMESYLNSRLCK